MRYPLKNWRKIKRGYKFGEKTFYSDFHLGVDYFVNKGTPVYAPHDCEIIRAGDFPEGGKTVHASFAVRDYGEIVMRFMHLSKYSAVGKYKEGAIIGYTGNTGKLTRGPHLHVDISRKSVDLKNISNFIDPEKFFGRLSTSRLAINC
ncbi:MAG: M23 family metallopeptidase [Parcubacteria group bacterium]|jgi:murein DD-endopeptidase MepM/ murein hydrolase activator NlpD